MDPELTRLLANLRRAFFSLTEYLEAHHRLPARKKSRPQKARGELANRVVQARNKRGWSQSRLTAEVVTIGQRTEPGFKLRQSAIGNLEAGKVGKPSYMVFLAMALNVSPQWLQTGEDPPRRRSGSLTTTPAPPQR